MGQIRNEAKREARRDRNRREREAVTIKERIRAALVNAGGRMNYHALMHVTFPPAQYPKAWRHPTKGGPPGCAFAFGRALRELQTAGIVWDSVTHPRMITLR